MATLCVHWTHTNAETNLHIVTSIKPLALITSELTVGTRIKVDYLLPPTVSEHNYALRFSDTKRLQSAGLVIWLGSDFEPYLKQAVSTWSEARHLPLIAQHGGVSSKEETAGHGAEHNHDDGDPHIWLDPAQARVVASRIAARLEQLAPEEAVVIRQNLRIFEQETANLDTKTAIRLAPYRKMPFLVYHRAYDQFVKRYQLNQVGVLHAQPGVDLSVRQLAELQGVVSAQKQPVCLFREPQYAGSSVPALKVSEGLLDPLGIAASSYSQMIDGLSTGLVECFEKIQAKKKA